LNSETGEAVWVDPGRKEQAAQNIEPLSEDQTATPDQDNQTRDRTARREDAARNEPPESDVVLFNPIWSDDGTKAVLQARSADNKDRRLLLLDPATGKTKMLTEMHEDAWIGGPDAFTLGWMPDNKRVYFQSERDGFSHLYTVSIEGGDPVQLTLGKFE